MPNLRSDGKPRSAPVGRVKAATRASGSAPALALTRPAGADHTSISKSPLTHKTVAEEPLKAHSRPSVNSGVRRRGALRAVAHPSRRRLRRPLRMRSMARAGFLGDDRLRSSLDQKSAMPSLKSLAPQDGRQSDTALFVARGTRRLLRRLNFSTRYSEQYPREGLRYLRPGDGPFGAFWLKRDGLLASRRAFSRRAPCSLCPPMTVAAGVGESGGVGLIPGLRRG